MAGELWDSVVEFFSPEAGQRRRQALDQTARDAGGLMQYYLGPTGVPDRLESAAGLLQFTDAGDMMEAGNASRNMWNNPSVGNAADLTAAGLATAIPFVSAKMMDEGIDVVGDALRSGADDVAAVGRRANQRAPMPDTNMFAGPKAKTADVGLLARAQGMAADGANRNDIWDQTGWFKGADGQWRFEIDDSGALMKPFASQNQGDYYPLDDSFAHLGLKRAYPDMFDNTGTAFRYEDSPYGSSGAFRPDNDSITVRAASEPRMDEATSTSLHELQHSVQNREGFASGSSPGEMALAHMQMRTSASDHADALALLEEVAQNGGDWDKALRDFQDLGDGITSSGRELAEQFGDVATARRAMNRVLEAKDKLEPLRQPGQWQQDAGFGPYNRVSGEVEARNVQARRDFTPEQRRANPPWTTQDVPDAEQIVRFDDGVQLQGLLSEQQNIDELRDYLASTGGR